MIQFRKPYHRRAEGEIENGIVTFCSFPWVNRRTQNPDPLKAVVNEHKLRYNLVIDLWLFRLRFEWESGWKNGLPNSLDYDLPKDYELVNKWLDS